MVDVCELPGCCADCVLAEFESVDGVLTGARPQAGERSKIAAANVSMLMTSPWALPVSMQKSCYVNRGYDQLQRCQPGKPLAIGKLARAK
jgi:hypothetical protein